MSEYGYQTVDVDAMDSVPAPCRSKKEVDEAVGASAFGFNVYEADPGERLPWGYHRHPEHEELFYVLAGELAFETADGTHRVAAGQAFFVPEDHPNAGRAVGEEPARVVAVGAPKATAGAVLSEECPECGAVTDREFEKTTEGDERVVRLYCSDCGAMVAERRR